MRTRLGPGLEDAPTDARTAIDEGAAALGAAEPAVHPLGPGLRPDTRENAGLVQGISLVRIAGPARRPAELLIDRGRAAATHRACRFPRRRGLS